MKKKLVISSLLFSIISLIILSLVLNGKKQLDTTTNLIEVKQEKFSLINSVNDLNVKHHLTISKLNEKDSILREQKEIILEQKKDLILIKKESSKIKTLEPIKEIIYIHDTVFITEKKNFWGKTKKTIQQSTSVDSLRIFEEVDTID